MNVFVAFAIGLLFSGGLIVSEMINPAKVIAFLDLFGTWDPSLAFVMVGAVLVTMLGYRILFAKSQKPVWQEKFYLPTRTDVDRHILAGPIIFGAGWGLVGLCPGPAIAALAVSPGSIGLFFAAMVGGMFIAKATR